MPTVNHDSGYSDQDIIVLFAQLALIPIEELVGKL